MLFLSAAGSEACAAAPASAPEGKDSVSAAGLRSGTRRLTVGGYGEAVVSRNFYSDNWKRYTDASMYRNDKGHGRFDLPHVTLFLGYDFGHGWSMGSEVEFEHGGTESAVEIEEEETGEYESEIERGGEVALEQFWLQKSFMPQLNVRLGHIIVPVGSTNSHHTPTEYFGVYRPEGDNTICPARGTKPASAFGGGPERGATRFCLWPGLMPTASITRTGYRAAQARPMSSRLPMPVPELLGSTIIPCPVCA